MKKVFLSVPMRGRTKENIEKSLEKMKAYARIVLGNDIEFINTKVEEKSPYGTPNEAMWYLGKSIQLLSQADVLICVNTSYWLDSPGCEAEKRIFLDYRKNISSVYSLKYIELPIYLVLDEEEYNMLYETHMQQNCIIGGEGSTCKSI